MSHGWANFNHAQAQIALKKCELVYFAHPQIQMPCSLSLPSLNTKTYQTCKISSVPTIERTINDDQVLREYDLPTGLILYINTMIKKLVPQMCVAYLLPIDSNRRLGYSAWLVWKPTLHEGLPSIWYWRYDMDYVLVLGKWTSQNYVRAVLQIDL